VTFDSKVMGASKNFHLMQRKNVSILALFALALAPAVNAANSPIIATLDWSPNPNTVPGSDETGAVGVAIDADCPSGGTYSGTLFVTTPGGVKIAGPIVDFAACGTTLTFHYGGVGGIGSTTACGTYNTEWGGETFPPGSFHQLATFDVRNTFTVTGCHIIPEFPGPLLLVVGAGLALLAVMRRSRLLKV
jgi:hypothetical protein